MRYLLSISCVLFSLGFVICNGNYDGYGGGRYSSDGTDKLRFFGPGFHRGSDGVAALYNNAARQLAVNAVARRIGTGTGTGQFYGVPGTGLDFTYSPGIQDGYGNQGSFGNYGYGNQGRFSNYGYGNQGNAGKHGYDQQRNYGYEIHVQNRGVYGRSGSPENSRFGRNLRYEANTPATEHGVDNLKYQYDNSHSGGRNPGYSGPILTKIHLFH